MAMDLAPTFVAKRGCVALADPGTAPPLLTTYDPDAQNADWTAFHTSADNLPKLGKDGGEATTLATWWVESAETSRSKTDYSVEFYGLQWDWETLHAAWPSGNVTTSGGYAVGASGDSEKRAVFVFSQNGAKRFGLWFPRVDLAIGDMPEFDPEKFMEIHLSGTALGAETAITGLVKVGQPFVLLPPVTVVEPTP